MLPIKKRHAGILVALACMAMIGLAIYEISAFHTPPPPAHTNQSIELRIGSSNQVNVTYVTALYDIGREGRPFEHYKEWTIETLKLPQAFIIYCSAENLPWIMQARVGQATIIILEPTPPLEYTVQNVKKILERVSQGRTNPEWTNPRYVPLQFSKAIWLQRAMASNPFQSSTFFWIDAGLSRFFSQTNMHYNLSASDARLEPDRVYITLGQSLAELAANPVQNIGMPFSFLQGGFFGGHSMPLARVCQALLNVYFTRMLARHRLDTEQVAFHLIYEQHKSWFRVLDKKAHGCGFMCM